MKRFVLPVIAVMLLGGCAGLSSDVTPGDDSPGAGESPLIGSPAEGESAALGLIDLWRVSGAEGEGDATWLRLDAQEFQLWRDCGVVSGSWAATNAVFLAEATVATEGCAGGGLPTAGWLEKVASFAPGLSGYDLLDAGGAVLASLTVDGAPEPIAALDEAFTRPPEVTNAVRALFAAPAALPDVLIPAKAGELVGRWVPTTKTGSTDPHAVFSSGGGWVGSDGCNGTRGRWAVSGAGEFLATVGPSTLMYCEGAPVPSWLAQAKSGGMTNDGVLVLFDTDGIELGRLIRA